MKIVQSETYTKAAKNLPLCLNCLLPFKCRVKRVPIEKFIFRNQNFKKY